MMTFRQHPDVAIVEYRDGRPVKDTTILAASVTEVGPRSVTARFGDRCELREFLLDAQGHA